MLVCVCIEEPYFCWCAYYVAGLRKVLVQVSNLVLAPGHDFLVASSAVSILQLCRLSSSTMRLSFHIP